MKKITVVICLIISLGSLIGCSRTYRPPPPPLTPYEACLLRIMGPKPSFGDITAGMKAIGNPGQAYAQSAARLNRQRQDRAVRAEKVCQFHLRK
jgi:hypothetical protein